MLNALWNAKLDDAANVLAMMKGHQYFLDRNTGVTNDAQIDHFVFNPEYILSNNRHFIAASMQEAQPNGDATTEGQALQIIGYCYAYMGTRDKTFLDAAIRCFDAYIDYFYGGQPIPNPPAPYICNWLVNGKEPVLANYPIDWESPTHSGFKGEMMTYTNGKTLIPHGAPYFGEYLDKATFAFVGALGWDSIVATVYGINTDGSTNWNDYGEQYDVDWIINWEGKKIDWDGYVLSEGHPLSEYGTIQLKNTGLNGEYKTNFSPKVPVEHGGYMMGRNEAWHNRPLNVPVTVEHFGNAADAELWFADAAYLLYKLTGVDRYRLVWQCVLKTTDKYSDVDQYDKFFRRSTSDKTPFTDGISYDYTYPNTTTIDYGRDTDGYITMTSDASCQHTMEQQAVWFRISKDSKIYAEYGGVDSNGGSLSCSVYLTLSPVKNADDPANRRYVLALPPSTSATPRSFTAALSSFTPVTDLAGQDYFLARANRVYSWGTGIESTEFLTSIYDGRSASVQRCTYPDDDAGYGIGFWSTDSGRMDVKNIVYQSNGVMRLNIEDSNLWRWYWELPVQSSFANRVLDRSNLVLSSYQPNHSSSDPLPRYPDYIDLEDITITPMAGNTSFWWYCINEIPETYSANDGYTMLASIELSGDAPMVAKLGDLTIKDYKDNNLFCTPGVIPFSNISVPDTEQFDGWRGCPYPGYQYPFVYSIDSYANEYTERLNNMVEFLWQSQLRYFNNYGQLGPGMSAYIWNRWDNLKYGDPDTWTMSHWGPGNHAWAGYQARAYAGAARAWYELVIQGKPVPPKLIEYVDNWSKWLYPNFKTHGCNPTDWLVDGTPIFDLNDYTGHMSGLWLAGACFSVLAGSSLDILPDYIELTVKEIEDHYINTGVGGQIMNGSWSPAVRLGTDNGMFFGFWSGETLRGLGMYLLYKQCKPKQNMYTLI